MIKINGLTKSYSNQAVLHAIQFEAKSGEMIAIIGASGSGKSVLLKCLARKEKWDKGTFEYNGQPVQYTSLTGLYNFRKEWAYLPPSVDLSLGRTALQNVLRGNFFQSSLFRKLFRKPNFDAYTTAMDYLENVGLLKLAHRKVETMSGGEKQRVALAKAYVHGAKVIVADDPAAGLDPHAAEAIMKDLRQLCDEKDMTVLFTAPQLDIVQKYATRIIGLADGHIKFDVSGRRLTSSEKNAVGLLR